MKKLFIFLLFNLIITSTLGRIPFQSDYQLSPDEKAAGLLYIIDKKENREESSELEMETLKQLLEAADQAGIDLETTEIVQEALKNTAFEKHWKKYNAFSKASKRNVLYNMNAIVPFLIQASYYGYQAYLVYTDPDSHRQVVIIIEPAILNSPATLRNVITSVAHNLSQQTVDHLGNFALPVMIGYSLEQLLPSRHRQNIQDPNEILGSAISATGISLLCLAPHANRAYKEYDSQDKPPLIYLGSEDEDKEDTTDPINDMGFLEENAE